LIIDDDDVFEEEAADEVADKDTDALAELMGKVQIN